MEQAIQAGLALDLTVRVTGGIEYKRRTIKSEWREGGAKVEEWETEKITRNPEEHAKAVKVRADVRNSITRLCARTPIGDLLLVPPDQEDKIRIALDAASAMIDAHNSKATHHYVVLGCVPSRLVPDDRWTLRSISGEIMATLGMMEAGIAGANVERIREASDSACKILPMLTPAASKAIGLAIEEARRAAREITRRIIKGNEDPIDVIPEIQERSSAIDAAKVTFLDNEGKG
jgi:hypothetical protein